MRHPEKVSIIQFQRFPREEKTCFMVNTFSDTFIALFRTLHSIQKETYCSFRDTAKCIFFTWAFTEILSRQLYTGPCFADVKC
jgi:hypothetical protein